MKRAGLCWILSLLLGAYALAAWRIAAPGLQYDEVLFVNAARGGSESDLFVAQRVEGVPVLVMAYMGALKAWIYYPILKAFPFGAATIREPAIALGLTGGLLLVAGLGRLLGREASLLAAPVVLLDPTLLLQSRLDWGPSALMFLLRGVVFFSLCSWASTRNFRWLLVAVGAAILGTFDKLNFLWFAAAALGAFLLCFWPALVQAARRQRIRFVLLAALAVAAGSVALYRAWTVAASLPAGGMGSFAGHGAQVARLLALVACGCATRDFVSGTGFGGCAPVAMAWALLLAVAAATAFRIRGERSRPFLFVALTLLGTAAFMALTPAAQGVHHAALIAGLPQVAVIAACFAARPGDRGNEPAKSGTALPVAVLLLACAFIASIVRTERLFPTPANLSWDRANQDAAACAAATGRPCVVADWGLSTLLAGYCRSPGLVLDAWEVLGYNGGAPYYAKAMDTSKAYEVVAHTRNEYTPGSGAALVAALKGAGWTVESRRSFPAWDGADLVEVYAVRHP